MELRSRLGDHFYDQLGQRRAARRAAELETKTASISTAEPVNHIADYAGSITTATIPSSNEQMSSPSIKRRAVKRVLQSAAYSLASVPVSYTHLTLPTIYSV